MTTGTMKSPALRRHRVGGEGSVCEAAMSRRVRKERFVTNKCEGSVLSTKKELTSSFQKQQHIKTGNMKEKGEENKRS